MLFKQRLMLSKQKGIYANNVLYPWQTKIHVEEIILFLRPAKSSAKL
jgi:hypothetical protein